MKVPKSWPTIRPAPSSSETVRRASCAPCRDHIPRLTMRRPFRSRSWSQAKLRNPFRIRRRPPAAELCLNEGQSPKTAQQLRPTHSSRYHTAPPAQQNRGPGHVRARRDFVSRGFDESVRNARWFFSRASEQGIAHGADCCAAGFRPRLSRRGVEARPFDPVHAMSGLPPASGPPHLRAVGSTETGRQQMMQRAIPAVDARFLGCPEGDKVLSSSGSGSIFG